MIVFIINNNCAEIKNSGLVPLFLFKIKTKLKIFENQKLFQNLIQIYDEGDDKAKEHEYIL